MQAQHAIGKQHTVFNFELNFQNFIRKELVLLELLATTLSPLGLTFFNSMLVLLAI
jgi:hypothetical protein